MISTIQFTFFLIFASNFAALAICRPFSDDQPRQLRKRMIGGRDAAYYEAPFVVRILLGGRVICTGSIISHDSILTAAHCGEHYFDYFRTTKNKHLSRLEVLYSPDHRFYQNQQKILVTRPDIRIHPQYFISENNYLYDIAVIKLQQFILPNGHARAIELDLDGSEAEQCDRPVTMYGFGSMFTDTDMAKNLQVAQTYIINNCLFNWLDDWKKIYFYINLIWTVTERHLVLTEKYEQSSRDGDSGGPLVVRNGRQDKVIGVLGGVMQDDTFAANYTFIFESIFETNYFVKVSLHTQFILDAMNNP